MKTLLVQVPVIVSEGGRYVTDLNKEDFELREDGVVQTIELFKSVDEPFTVALLLDCSGSTQDQLSQIKRAAEAFVDNLRPFDRVMVISFDDSVHVQCEFTSDRGELRR
ncbi:MAG TPA: VWA domain-containing protein, partial [Blastocatellia bacterium]|nr:VWA domain-containing protein [Blastocatellia bacterium]